MWTPVIVLLLPQALPLSQAKDRLDVQAFVRELGSNRARYNEGTLGSILAQVVGRPDHPEKRIEMAKAFQPIFPDRSSEVWQMARTSATIGGSIQILRFLLDSGVPLNPDGYENWDFSKAIEADHIELVRFLIHRGWSPTLACRDRIPGAPSAVYPIHLAAFVLAPRTLRILKGAGADINARNQKGETPLHAAVLGCTSTKFDAHAPYRQYLKQPGRTGLNTIRTILALGGNPQIKTKKGETPLDIAKRKNLPSVVSLLRSRR